MHNMSTLPKYVLVTPARNEAEFIELTIQSVAAQTNLPVRWVIVSDGSTDSTDEIVQKYAVAYPWIELLRMPERHERHFAGKVYAFNAGYTKIKDLEHEVVASLDADITFDNEYFDFLLRKMAVDPHLGVVGTPFDDGGETYDYRFVNIEHVSGACQLFRRSCFESIGGYLPVKTGSIDHIAVITARMMGWKTRTFTEKRCIHHRALGTAQANALRSRFNYGFKDYVIGNHPLWEAFRVVYQMTQYPYILGGAALGVGYISALLRRADRPVSRQFIAFHRNEQMVRLKKFFLRHQLTESEELGCAPEYSTKHDKPHAAAR